MNTKNYSVSCCNECPLIEMSRGDWFCSETSDHCDEQLDRFYRESAVPTWCPLRSTEIIVRLRRAED